METIKFYIQSYGHWCRIVARDCRTCYKEYNTACISDIETLLFSMRFIKSDIEERYGNDVSFEYVDMTSYDEKG